MVAVVKAVGKSSITGRDRVMTVLSPEFGRPVTSRRRVILSDELADRGPYMTQATTPGGISGMGA
jgi:hypothetical protein